MINEFKDFSKSYIASCSDNWEKETAQKHSADIMKKIKSLKPSEQQDYLFSRMKAAKASIHLLNENLSYVGGTDGLINYYCIEQDIISGFIKEQDYKDKSKTVFKQLNDSYINNINKLSEPYGYSKRDIAFELERKIHKLSPAQM